MKDDLRNCGVVRVNGKRFGLLLGQDTRITLVLEYRDGQLVQRTYATTCDEPVTEVVSGGKGRLGLFEAVLRHGPLEGIHLPDFTLGEQGLICAAIDLSFRYRRIWEVGLAAVGELVEQPFVLQVANNPDNPIVLRAALLPSLKSRELQRQVVAEARSSRWHEDERFYDIYGAALAYLFARENGIPVDDPEGVKKIRQHGICGVLRSSGKVPWITPDTSPL